MKVTIGKTFKEYMNVDFDKTPHMVCGGTTGYGKTNLIKVIMTDLITQNPKDAEFFLFDLKLGGEFSRYEHLKQVKSLAIDLNSSVQHLIRINEYMEDRINYFKENRWHNIVETPIKKRSFIIIDEAGEFVSESFMDKETKEAMKYCQYLFSRLARLGRAYGFSVLLCSQYTTADVLPRQVKMNADAKICFRTQAGYASEVMLGEGNTDAARLKDIPGRAILIKGPNKYELQVPYMDNQHMDNLLSPYYETERKDVTHETTREDPSEVIEIGDSQP